MKLNRYFLTAISALAVAACGNLSKVSDEGITDNPVWPKIEDSTFNSSGTQYGSWPNRTNVDSLEKGMNKDQIRQLIGQPHFAEGFAWVREWDYVFNYREQGQHKVCQFKILFDKNMDAQSFLWYPANCNNTYGDDIELSADLLFDYNKDSLTPQGQKLLEGVAKVLSNTDKSFTISGYADRLGSESYNLKLSQRRADRVKNELLTLGIAPNRIASVVGHGNANPVKACDNENGTALQECLRPNRRVVIALQ